MKSIIALFLSLALTAGGVAGFDKLVHDFGTVSQKDGELSCTFTFSNDSEEPVSIFAVISSCGCTDVTWTREPIAPGAKGSVSATYSNDEGPYPFDKVLRVYTSSQKKPIVLHIKGVVKKNGK